MIDQDKGPAMRKTNAAGRFLRRMLCATCLSVAAARGAYASTLVESSLPMLDSYTTAGSASVLPDGTIIVHAPISTNGATGLVRFSNLASNPALGSPDASGNASPVAEASDGSNLLFNGRFDQQIFGAASVTFPVNVPGAGILSSGLELDEGPGIFAIAAPPPDAETSDSAALALTGLGFLLAGVLGRGPEFCGGAKRRRTVTARSKHGAEMRWQVVPCPAGSPHS